MTAQVLLGEKMSGASVHLNDRGANQPITISDFLAHMPDHRYLCRLTRDLWPAASVDARLPWPVGSDGVPVRPSRFLDEHSPIEQMTWAPGEPEIIVGRIIDNGG